MIEQKDSMLKDTNYLAVRGQRLSRAVYLVSSFISDHDPLKWRIRERALDLLNDSQSLGHNFETSEIKGQTTLESNIILNKINGHLDQLLSLMKLALTGGMISEMNFSLLKQETSVLLETVSQEIKETSFSHYFNQAITSADKIKTVNGLPVAGGNQQVSTPKTAPKDVSAAYQNDIGHFSSSKNKGQISVKISHDKTSQDYSQNQSRTDKSENRDNRKKVITDFVTGRGWTSIKDIATSVHGCSEKTVQRLLVEMVEDGVLKKQGERRWSRYMMV